MWLVQLPSGLREAWGWPKRVDNPFFRCAPPKPPQLRGRGERVLPRGRGPVRGVGLFRGGGVGPFRRPAGRFCGAFRSARAVGAVVRARAASRLRSRGVSRGAFGAPVLAGGSGVAVPTGGLAPVLSGGVRGGCARWGPCPCSCWRACGVFWGVCPSRELGSSFGVRSCRGFCCFARGACFGGACRFCFAWGACFGGACRFCFARGVCLFGGA